MERRSGTQCVYPCVCTIAHIVQYKHRPRLGGSRRISTSNNTRHLVASGQYWLSETQCWLAARLSGEA